MSNNNTTNVNTFECNFCKKTYSTLSSLNNHKKTAKFCLDLQNKLNTGELVRCDFCLKEFSTKKYLTQHLDHCKNKKLTEQSDLKKDFESLQKEIIELKLKLQFKDELNEKLQKEIEELSKRPTTSIINNNTNNYQIEFNQLVQNIEAFNQTSLSNKIKSITIEEMDSYDPKNLEDSLSHTLCNTLKDYTFCTDKARKIVVIKKEDGSTQKMQLKEFINLSLNTNIVDIRNYIKELEVHYDTKWTTDRMTTENFEVFDVSLQKIKESMNKNDIDITDNGHPLKMLPDKVLSNCKHITK
jgi:hypothetical protein